MTPDATQIRDILVEAGLAAPTTLTAWQDRPGTTSRILVGTIDGKAIVAKIADAPETLERARREARVLEHLRPILEDVAPRLLATRIETRRVVLVVERIEGRHGDAVTGARGDDLEAIVDRLAAVWSLDAHDHRLIGLGLPEWGRGTPGAEPHRRRRGRLARRIDVARMRFGDAALDRASAAPLLERFEHLAKRTGRVQPCLVHGDLHLDNVVFTDRGPRILDWQKTSLGDPLDDLARLFLEAAPSPHLEQLLDIARRLPGPTPAIPEVATSALLAWSGFITGLAGRPDLGPGSRDHRLVERLLGIDGPGRLLAQAIDAVEG